MKICFVTCLIPQVLGCPVSGAYCWRWHDDVTSFILSHSPVGLYFEDHFYNSLVLWYIGEKQVEHVLMSFSVVATTTTSWSKKWDSGIAWSVVGRIAVYYSRGTYLQERRLFSVDTLRIEVSRKEICQNSVFSEVTLRLRNFGIFCRADTSLSLVSPCLVASWSVKASFGSFGMSRKETSGELGRILNDRDWDPH